MDVIERAFETIYRKDFLPQNVRDQANIDRPLPIGYGQTNSQPSTVRMMLEWLGAVPGEKILDIGSGSGWTSALLSQIVSPDGQVFAVERMPELVKMGRNNCKKVGIKNVKFFQAGKQYGLVEHSPYDRILVSASANKLPKEIIDQLKVSGKLVIPVQNDVLEITKTSEDTFDVETHPGFAFVPLV